MSKYKEDAYRGVVKLAEPESFKEVFKQMVPVSDSDILKELQNISIKLDQIIVLLNK